MVMLRILVGVGRMHHNKEDHLMKHNMCVNFGGKSCADVHVIVFQTVHLIGVCARKVQTV